MNHTEKQAPAADPLAFLTGGGEMGRLMRAHDWSATPLGPVSGWPQSLKTAVRIMLGSRYPMFIWWGRELVNLYNDGYLPMLGKRHPNALGRPAAVIWSEIWDTIGPQTDAVLYEGRATWNEERLLVLERNGYPEEAYFTFSYSPVPGDDGGVGGIFCALTEDTQRVLGQRRLRTLRELSARTTAARTVGQACQAATETLAQNPHDVPFALIYLLVGEGGIAQLAGATGLPEGSPSCPLALDLLTPDGQAVPWPLGRVGATGRAELVEGLEARFGRLRCGVWPVPPKSAIVLPVLQSGQDRLAGFLVAGISPRREFDDDYRGFMEMLAGHVATAVANARTYEEERRRAEALAELDRTKTAFFSNVSHEFRTPLTLMLGPVEDALAEMDGALPPSHRERLEVVHRNGLRLQRLVNTLLDFSRIEAGRLRASYEPTDLAALTADHASNFRSACQKAGLRLKVDCPPLAEPVFVDRQMWEKIVLNLLSNAFKFTFEGEIVVSVRPAPHAAELRVVDTGTGIPAEEMPRLFERFHRVENARGRTHEGSGIGLALVHELVKLHGGSITAVSEVGRGSTFVVTVPLGSAHLPRERVGTGSAAGVTTRGASSFVEEALRWVPDAGERRETAAQLLPHEEDLSAPTLSSQQASGDRPRVLVADDNADTRRYLVRLLSGRYAVEAVADGEAALAAVRRRPPDLVLSDVMMPRLDGFGLLRALRADSRTAGVPIIMVSARAGEESRVVGMEAGADDYLVKPFGARELLARVGALLQITRLRRESERAIRLSEQELADFFDNATVGLHWVGPDGTILRANRAELHVLGYSPDEYVGHHIAEFHADRDVIEDILRRLWANETLKDYAARMRCKDGSIKHVLIDSSVLWEDGNFLHTRCFTRDVTERKLVEETRQRLAAIVESSDDAIISKDLDGTITSWNRAAERLYGYAAEEIVGRPVSVLMPPDHKDDFPAITERLRRGERIEHYETVRVAKDGRRVNVSLTISPLRNSEGEVVGASKIAHDVTERKRTEAALQKQTERLQLLWEAAAVLLTADNPDAMLRGLLAKIGPHLGVDTYFNFAVNDSGDALRLASCEGIPVETARTITRLEFGQAICGTVALHRRPIVATHIQRSDDPKVQLAKSFGLRAYACNPLLAGDRLLGTLSFASRQRDQFDPDELAFMETLCHYVTFAYERLRLVNELKEADRRKDEFLATLAHELRNPLAPVRNAVQVLRLKGPDEPELRWGRDVIERQVEHLTRLIDDLMDISRITRNKLELRKQRIELAEVVQGAVESSRPAIEQCGHELTVTLPPQPVYLSGDLVRLAQVFLNLLTNAAKYTERGGRIWLTAEREGSDVVVRVKDTGVGIHAEKLPRLFEMFFQVDRTLERSQGGLGIGLSLVRRLVELHGGRVEARSEGVGKGSEFIVRLPVLVEKQTPPPSQEPGGGKTKTPARRILVVDDNRDSADSLAMLLRLTGNEVHTAYDGVEGVEAAERFRPEVVLLDIGMPRLNGYDACRRIRVEAWGKGLVLIAMTGWGQEEDRRRTVEAGFDAHLVKPVNPMDLDKLLAGLLLTPASSSSSTPCS